MTAEGKGGGFDGASGGAGGKSVPLLPEYTGHWYDGGDTYSKPEGDVVGEKPRSEIFLEPDDVLTPEEAAERLKAKEETNRADASGQSQNQGSGESVNSHGSAGSGGKKEGSQEGSTKNPERILIDEIKDVIKGSGVLTMEEGEERKAAADLALKAARINGVGDLEGLLAARNNKNINQEGIDRKIDALATAINEVIEETGTPEMKQAVQAGSFSTVKFLPEAWRIVVEGDERDQSLARVIVDKAIGSKVSNPARRDAISNEMETVDYYLNNPQYGMLLKQVDAAIVNLKAMQNSARLKEMSFISEKIIYLEG
jgi:hypothetical protein